MRLLFNLVCTVSILIGLGATAAWVRSYYAADQLTYRRPFEPGGERLAAQAKSDRGTVTFIWGKERVEPKDLSRLQRDDWTKPGLTHFEKPLATPPVAAMAEARGAVSLSLPQTQPAQTQPAQTQPATASSGPASPDLIERLGTFSHASDPRTGVVRVGRQRINVATDRTVTVFPHWALVAACFALPALKYAFSGARRMGRRSSRRRRGNSFDEWASRTPPELRRRTPLSRLG